MEFKSLPYIKYHATCWGCAKNRICSFPSRVYVPSGDLQVINRRTNKTVSGCSCSYYFFNKKNSLNLNIQKTKIMASGPITPWQINGKTMETVTDFIFLGSKITVDGDCNHDIKRRLLLGRKAMTNLDSILKSRDITLPMKAHIVKLWFSQ